MNMEERASTYLDENNETVNTNEDGMEEDTMSPQQVIHALVKHWRNEKCSPELLPHKFEIVDSVSDQLTNMNTNLANNRTKNRPVTQMSLVHEIEVNRIRYVLVDYIRVRLAKIEQFVDFYLSTDENKSKMSQEEQEFAESYAALMHEYLTTNVMKHLPQQAGGATLDMKKYAPQPNTDSFVVAKVEGALHQLVIPAAYEGGQEETLMRDELPVGGWHILPYTAVALPLTHDTVTLI